MERKMTEKFPAYILRHNPAAVGTEVDKNGWVNVSELIDGVSKSGVSIDAAMLQ